MHRFRLEVSGQVQSVGFRPFVYQLAHQLKLPGRVFNAGLGAIIDLQSDAQGIEQFVQRLQTELPKVARIDQLNVIGPEAIEEPLPFPFCIEQTQAGNVQAPVMPDLALCTDCLHDMFTEGNARYRYPLINCTYCGPRYSIIRQLPYDRPQTSMADYDLCPKCISDYQDPTNRRFHAQPIACEHCGPTVYLKMANGPRLNDEDPFTASARLIKEGAIIAMKGIGGFHLVCDATNEEAVQRLRQRKHRPAKPLAVMGLNLQSLDELVCLTPLAKDILSSREAPLTLLKSKPNKRLATGIAPQLNRFGVMLPYTPMQYLLLHALADEPTGLNWLQQPLSQYLVMTSANLSGMPIVYDNQQAEDELAHIADYFLMHDRSIVMRNDDAIVDASGDSLLIVRRGRGMAPDRIPLPDDGDSVLATGSELKSNVCVSRHAQAYLSQYIGDLDNGPNRAYLKNTVAHLTSILNIKPDFVACDLHPDFFSHQFAASYAKEHGIPLVTVQHHHAHAASVIAEHQLSGTTMAVILDGFGLSEKNELWGGELLLLDDLTQYTHLGSFAPLPLPGGDKASQQGWRIAAGFLHAQDRWPEVQSRFSSTDLTILKQMLERSIQTPFTSSAGRLFDCAAALLGISLQNQFESQSAMRLQAEAEIYLESHPAAFEHEILTQYFEINAAGRLDFSKLLLALLDQSAAEGAAFFHCVLRDALVAWVVHAARINRCKQIVLSGGVWLNRWLLTAVMSELKNRKFMVYCNEKTPVNDGNISYGQLAVVQAVQNKQTV